MKAEYKKPTLEITRFEAHDVIATSSSTNMTQEVNEQIEKANVGIKNFTEQMK